MRREVNTGDIFIVRESHIYGEPKWSNKLDFTYAYVIIKYITNKYNSVIV